LSCLQKKYFSLNLTGKMNTYFIAKSASPLPLAGKWDGPCWNKIDAIAIDNFLNGSSDHRPVTQVKAVHDGRSVHILFKVTDRYVRSTRTKFLDDVWNDSCVEWFVQPKEDKGYFNFEVNCGGTLYASYIEDPARINDSLKKFACLTPDLGAMVGIHHSLPSVVDPEITAPLEWTIELAVPLSVLEHYVGPIGPLSGRKWRANFNKCADQTSHPSWATWNPVTERNFHRPREFGVIVFE
jgi:hypothetical protein